MKTAIVAVFALSALSPIPSRAETAAERWGRAQTQYNSYEARREWRERNVQTPNLTSPSQSATNAASVVDSTPRSGSEVAAEHQRKMDAMQKRWDDGCGFTLQERMDCAARKQQAAFDEEFKKAAAESRKRQAKENKAAAKLQAKALKMAFKSDEKWDEFFKEIPPEERKWVIQGYEVTQHWHSPFADFARDFRDGSLKPIEGDGMASARKILERCAAFGNLWCVNDLGDLLIVQDPQNGEKNAVELYAKAHKRLIERRLDPNLDIQESTKWYSPAGYSLSVKLIRAYAYGWGTPVDLAKASEAFRFLDAAFSYEAGGLNAKSKGQGPQMRQAWGEAVNLYGELYAQGILVKQNSAYAQSWLNNAFVNAVESGDPRRVRLNILLTLLNAGGDLPDKAATVKELSAALDEGYTTGGGELAYRLLKGLGVPADPSKAYEITQKLPAMEPGAFVRLTKLWLGEDGVTRDAAKAIEMIERFGDPKNPEHAKLMEEARRAT